MVLIWCGHTFGCFICGTLFLVKGVLILYEDYNHCTLIINVTLTWCKVDDGIKHPLKYTCIRCILVKLVKLFPK